MISSWNSLSMASLGSSLMRGLLVMFLALKHTQRGQHSIGMHVVCPQDTASHAAIYPLFFLLFNPQQPQLQYKSGCAMHN